MLDEWREKFVLSQQEAIEIYTDMHRALELSFGATDTDGIRWILIKLYQLAVQLCME